MSAEKSSINTSIKSLTDFPSELYEQIVQSIESPQDIRNLASLNSFLYHNLRSRGNPHLYNTEGQVKRYEAICATYYKEDGNHRAPELRPVIPCTIVALDDLDQKSSDIVSKISSLCGGDNPSLFEDTTHFILPFERVCRVSTDPTTIAPHPLDSWELLAPYLEAAIALKDCGTGCNTSWRVNITSDLRIGNWGISTELSRIIKTEENGEISNRLHATYTYDWMRTNQSIFQELKDEHKQNCTQCRNNDPCDFSEVNQYILISLHLAEFTELSNVDLFDSIYIDNINDHEYESLKEAFNLDEERCLKLKIETEFIPQLRKIGKIVRRGKKG